MIQATALRKQFNGLVAVDNVTFQINRGEVFGLLGPNGAGKTTTINMLVGLLKPDAGAVEINGFPDPTQPSVRRGIGNAPQSLAIYEELTGEENLRFFAKLYGLSGKTLSERVRWGLEFAGLTERRRDRVKTYSGGMQRRLNLACALVHDPPILLLDEPTVGIDPQSRNQILGSIEQLKREGRTIVYTTHYMEEAQRLCDRVAIIDHGKILALGKVDELISEHGGLSVIEAELESLPPEPESIPGEIVGTTLKLSTEKPLEVFGKLAGMGLKFHRVRIDHADLESVFLNLTGRSLRD